jgi:hypothetical protein
VQLMTLKSRQSLRLPGLSPRCSSVHDIQPPALQCNFFHAGIELLSNIPALCGPCIRSQRTRDSTSRQNRAAAAWGG